MDSSRRHKHEELSCKAFFSDLIKYSCIESVPLFCVSASDETVSLALVIIVRLGEEVTCRLVVEMQL